MIRIIVLAVAVLILVAGIAVSESGGVVAQDESPAPTVTPTPAIIEPEPTETPLPKATAEPEYGRGCMGGETGDADNGCDFAEGQRQYHRTATPTPIPTATPVPTATAVPVPTATPVPDDDSSSSSSKKKKTLKAPPAPTAFTYKQGKLLTVKGKNSILLSWRSRGGTDHFRLWRGPGPIGPWTIHDDDIVGSPKEFTNFKCGTTYYLLLESYGDGRNYEAEYSDTSIGLTIRTTPCPPALPERVMDREECHTIVPVLPGIDKSALTKVARTSNGSSHSARSIMYRGQVKNWARLAIAALFRFPLDAESKCSFALVQSSSTSNATTTLKAALYKGSKTRLGTVVDGESTGIGGKLCLRSRTCLWETETQFSIGTSVVVFYVKSTHAIQAGNANAKLSTSAGLEVKTGNYRRVPSR